MSEFCSLFGNLALEPEEWHQASLPRYDTPRADVMSVHTRTVQHNYSVRRHPLARPLKPQSRPIPWGPNRERFPPPGKTQNLDTRNTNYSSLKSLASTARAASRSVSPCALHGPTEHRGISPGPGPRRLCCRPAHPATRECRRLQICTSYGKSFQMSNCISAAIILSLLEIILAHLCSRTCPPPASSIHPRGANSQVRAIHLPRDSALAPHDHPSLGLCGSRRPFASVLSGFGRERHGRSQRRRPNCV